MVLLVRKTGKSASLHFRRNSLSQAKHFKALFFFEGGRKYHFRYSSGCYRKMMPAFDFYQKDYSIVRPSEPRKGRESRSDFYALRGHVMTKSFYVATLSASVHYLDAFLFKLSCFFGFKMIIYR